MYRNCQLKLRTRNYLRSTRPTAYRRLPQGWIACDGLGDVKSGDDMLLFFFLNVTFVDEKCYHIETGLEVPYSLDSKLARIPNQEGTSTLSLSLGNRFRGLKKYSCTVLCEVGCIENFQPPPSVLTIPATIQYRVLDDRFQPSTSPHYVKLSYQYSCRTVNN
ncbi:hypothetical protein B9Z19DRAFT_1062574 [Tuber borchii]|uniref:Uncharacterized protein n=1 Tax=Tuber borchii TaxID=42251 RepID=A0A2T7A1H0_TUBBO|nr:hypothetical protein B9Z19DRAFT_1062574 [Tuber borchii]